MKNIYSLACFVELALMLSCIDPVNLNLISKAEFLVVDGLITNQAIPYTIKISRSIPYNNSGNVSTYFVPESSASVSVIIDGNEEVGFVEIKPGIYTSIDSDFVGEIGKSYAVKIMTANGNAYESDAERIYPVPAIDSIGYQYIIYNKFSTSGSVIQGFGFQVSVTCNDPIGEHNCYKWKSSGVIEYHSLTETGSATCWVNVPQLEAKIEVADDRLSDGKVFSKDIAIAPYERPTRFKVTAQQFSLTQRAFEFWDRVSGQQKNTGSVFDPPPAQIQGNIHNINDSNEIVLGYFGASAVSEKYVVFNRLKAANYDLPPNAVLPGEGDCKAHVFGGTDIRPEGF